MITTAHTCFDYATHQWLEGEPARVMRLAQLEEEIALVRSSEGQAYLDYFGCQETREEVIASLLAEISTLHA